MSDTIFEVIRPDCLQRVGTGQAVVEARLAPMAGTGFAKILSISCTATASLTEVFKGEARYGGRVNFCSYLYSIHLRTSPSLRSGNLTLLSSSSSSFFS